jgi:hypothetical protein
VNAAIGADVLEPRLFAVAQLAEATHLAHGAPGEWRLWYRSKAEQFGIEPDQFAELIEAQIAAREKAAAEKLAQDKLEEQKAERLQKVEAQAFREKVREDTATKKAKTKSKSFAEVAKLPADEHDGELEALAKLIAEDVEALKAEFGEYCAAEIASSTTPSDYDEPWLDPVATAQLLEELIATIDRHIVARPHEVLIIALWIMLA